MGQARSHVRLVQQVGRNIGGAKTHLGPAKSIAEAEKPKTKTKHGRFVRG